MKKIKIAILSGAVTFAGLLSLGCRDSAATFDLSSIKKVIDEKNHRFTNAHVTNDTAAIVDFFTQDARILAPNSDAVIGRPAITVLVSQYQKFDIKEFREETTALYGNKDYLIDEGSYFMSYGKDHTVEKGKYLNVWKKVDGDWKIYSNMWNTNTPAVLAK
jgi:ketosteroid isomerase-like protein